MLYINLNYLKHAIATTYRQAYKTIPTQNTTHKTYTTIVPTYKFHKNVKMITSF
jgi:hypothetical protein